MNWKVQAQRVQREAYVYYFAFKHPRVPWYAKLVAACSAAYLFSPIQLIPSYIPVIGFLDDFLVLFLAARLLQRIIPPEVLAECRALADAAEMRRKQEIRSTGAIIGFVAIAAVWLLVAAGVSILIARYISSDTAMAK
ncbi:MAG: YkvA family protein [Candidatus Acidiferrales bacterium]